VVLQQEFLDISFLVELESKFCSSANRHVNSGDICGFNQYFGLFIINKTLGFRLSEEEEIRGTDLSIHKIGAYPEDDIR